MSRLGRAAGTFATPASAGPLAIALLALLASGASVVNGFVYDDLPIVAYNSRVHTLAQWWDAFARAYWPPHWGNTHYRPVTILSFAVQWAVGGGSTLVFHAVSIALYAATCVATLGLARLVLPPAAAWVVAALFAVHPVHVEAVANVVGQSELIVGLCSVLAVGVYVRWRVQGPSPDATSGARPIAVIAGLYAVACFAKEAGFLLPGLLVAAELTVVAERLSGERRTPRARARELSRLCVACAVVGLAYLFARHAALGAFSDRPNVIVRGLSEREMLLTMLGVVPEWARLLLWPAQLAADYSPPRIPLVSSATPAALSGLAILVGVAVLAVVAWRVRSRVAAFGLAWFAIAIFPVSNVFVRSGVLLAERALFVPSVGTMLALGSLWVGLGRRVAAAGRSRMAVAAPLVTTRAVVLALGVARSATRSRVWRSTDAFYAQIVEDAPLSYRAHHAHGTWLFTKGRRAEGEKHLRMAIAMFPRDAGPATDLADHYRYAGLCAPASELYLRAIELGMLSDRARLGLVACLLRDERYAEAAAHARIGASGSGFQVAAFRGLLAVADSGVAAAAGARQTGAPRDPSPTKSEP